MTKEEINNRLKKLLEISDSNYEKTVSAYEKEVAKIYSKALKEIKSQIAAVFEKYGDEVNYSDMASYNRLKNLESQIADQIKELTKDVIKNTKEKLSFFFSESYYLTSYAIEKATGIELGFGLLDPLVIEAAWKNELSKIKWTESMQQHAQKYVSDIREELTRGLIEGKGYGKIAKAITERTGINAGKVLRIVRTEGHRVQSAAKIISFEKTEAAAERLGLKTNRVWLATLDNKTRDSHQTMDGQLADENNLFHYPGGETTEAPGISGPAEEVINCRCSVITQFAEFHQVFRRDGDGVLFTMKDEFLTYEKWKEGKGIKYNWNLDDWERSGLKNGN